MKAPVSNELYLTHTEMYFATQTLSSAFIAPSIFCSSLSASFINLSHWIVNIE